MSAMDPAAPCLERGLAGAGPATDGTRLSSPPPSANRGGMYSGYLFPGKSKPFSNFPKWDRQRWKIRLTDGRHLWGRRFGCSTNGWRRQSSIPWWLRGAATASMSLYFCHPQPVNGYQSASPPQPPGDRPRQAGDPLVPPARPAAPAGRGEWAGPPPARAEPAAQKRHVGLHAQPGRDAEGEGVGHLPEPAQAGGAAGARSRPLDVVQEPQRQLLAGGCQGEEEGGVQGEDLRDGVVLRSG